MLKYIFFFICISKSMTSFPLTPNNNKLGNNVFKNMNLEKDDFKQKIKLDENNIYTEDEKEGKCGVDNEKIYNLEEINRNFLKYKLLKTLLNTKLSTEYKLALIREYDELIYNDLTQPLYEGGLLNDWETNIF